MNPRPSDAVGSPDFEAFFRNSDVAAESHDRLMAAADTLQALLVDRGVDFHGLVVPRDDDETGLPLSFFQAVEAEYLQWRQEQEVEAAGESVDAEIAQVMYEQVLGELKVDGSRKISKLMALAASYAIQGVARDNATGEIPIAVHDRVKQTMQTSLLAEGFDPVWFEVVDEVFPGAPLPADEAEELAFEAQLDSFVRSAEYHAQLGSLMNEMELWLGGHGLMVDETMRGALHTLASTKIFNDFTNSLIPLPPRSAIDDARAILDERGLTGPAWQGLVQAYFNPPAAEA